MKHSKTKEKIKRALVIISNNFGANKEFYHTDIRQLLMAADIQNFILYYLKLSGVVQNPSRGVYILKEYNANTAEKVWQFVRKYHHEYNNTKRIKAIESPSTTTQLKLFKRTRRISDKYIVEQYEKRGLGKDNKTTLWSALKNLFAK